MAVLGRLLVSSAERLDLPDFLSLDSYTQGDFKFLLKSFVGDDKPFILKGFDVINPENSIGTQNISVRVSDSVVYYPGSLAGPFFHGLEEGNAQAAPLVPELRKNATNYVYLTLTTSEAAKDTRAFWDPDREGGEGGEFTQDVNTQTVLSADINVSVSSFPENTIPVCKVVVGANFIDEIEDARDMMFRLGSGGLNPNPLDRYNWREEPTSTYSRTEPNTRMTSALDPNPFQGGDKNIQSLKEWMDAVMTKLAELGGTTYWYEDTSVYNLINVFKDALATSIKSKGYWNSSDVTPGVLTWSEDIVIQQTVDLSETIIRAGSKTLVDNEVLYIDRVRDAAINTGGISVDWFNAVDHVNGQLGAFENLSKGDWIKKADDPDNLYLRVEEFYAAANKGGGVTAPGSALSIKLSAPYGGISESKQASYSKGIYLASEVSIGDRADQAIQDAAGNFYWLAMRSDTILNISDITTTTLSLDIENHDGQRARVTSVAHGLADGQRITIAGSANFDGTYACSVEDVDTFYIDLVAGPHADELAQSGYFATVTTAARSTDNGLQLESANHGLATDQRAIISDTSNYNGDYQVFPTGDTTFTIPVSSAIANETDGTSTAVNVYVRTDIGPTKLERGENKAIGEVETANLMSFIGMDSDAQTHPNYYITPDYNTIDGKENFNSDLTDNLTERASKLTSMMADRAQDKTIQLVSNHTTVTNTTNVTDQDITFSGGSGAAVVIMPSSENNGTIGLSGTLTLAANQVAYYQVDRNAAFNLANLSALTIADIDSAPLGENTFVFAYRLSADTVYLWNNQVLEEGDSIALSVLRDYVQQNKTVKLVKGGTWSWDSVSNELVNSSSAFVQVAGLAENVNEISAQTITLASDGQCAYITLKRDSGASTRTVTVADIASVPEDDHTFIIARRTNSEVVVGTNSFTLENRDHLTLDGAKAEIDRRLNQLKVNPAQPLSKRVTISASDILQLDGSTLSLEQKNLLLKFDGAQIDLETGEVFESDGVTPLLGGANDFVPFSIPASEYFYYSISLLPNTANADNTISGQILVIPASDSNAILVDAPKAPFPGTGIKLANVWVQEDGAGGINNIDYSNIISLGVGGSGSGGAGDATSDETAYRDRLSLSPFDSANMNIASVNEDDQLDGSSTATFDIPSGNFKFEDSTAQELISIQQLDSEFLDTETDIETTELNSIWDLESIDTAATYEVSRDGGNEWQTVSMDRVGQSSLYRGLHNFTEEAANAFNQEYAVANADATKDFNDTTQQWISQKFTVTNATTYKDIFTYINKNDAAATGGFYVEIVRDDTGAPSTDPNDFLWTSAFQNIDDLSVGNNVVQIGSKFVLSAGDYHLVIKPNAAYRSEYTSDNTHKISARMDSSSGPTPNLRTYDGSTWSAEVAGETMVYRLEGRELDLRVRITSSATADDKFLSSYAIFYSYEDGVQYSEPVFREIFSFDGTVDNLDEFTLTNFLPDSRLLFCFARGTGQTFRYGDFTLDGHVVKFPANTFNVVGTVELEFFQISSVHGVSSTVSDALTTANHLGSSDPNIDKSLDGRGIYLRRPDGTLREITIDDNDNIAIYSV